MTNEEIQGIFFQECDEALAAAEAGLSACRDGVHDNDTINAIFRAVHSIKGGAGAFGFTALQRYTHVFETLLSDVRDGVIAIDPALTALMLRALDGLDDHVSAVREARPPCDDTGLISALEAAQREGGVTAEAAVPAGSDFDFDLDAMLADIGGEVAQADNESGDTSKDWLVSLRPTDEALDNGGEPILLLRELVRLGGTGVLADVRDVPQLDSFDPDAAYLAWTLHMPATVTREDINDVFEFAGDTCGLTISRIGEAAVIPEAPVMAPVVAAAPVAGVVPVVAVASAVALPVEESATGASGAPAVSNTGQSIRIDLAKLDRLIDTVGELVIAQAMTSQRLSEQGLDASVELAMLDGLTRDIQESAMAIRAQPISSVFSRVPRMLRELEVSTGKRVRLEMAGETTELDKTVIERLGEPMTHLIRNAVDHGIETPADRIVAGKPAEGVLRLFAEHRGGRILIRISDDGRGIDRQRVLAKAVERGLVAADASLSDEDIDNLIFAPGFSTANVVSDISGRGVGMDVVRQNVKNLGGRVTVESRPGEGSVFTLALPLTLAISDGMIVTVGDQTLVVPLAHVVESLRPQAEEVARLGTGRQMLNVRGRFIPILPLADQVGARGAVIDPTKGVVIVVDTEATGQAALQVDTICDQRQFVIKSLSANFRAVGGVAGATILGDGRVALILDVDAVVAGSVETSLKDAA